jgi:predicted nucleic acid-binding protein
MRAYADTSFIIRLIRTEPDSSTAIAEFRKRERPPLFFLPLHHLEVRNGILQRYFFQRHSTSAAEKRYSTLERDQSLQLLNLLLKRGTLRDTKIDADSAFARAIDLALRHTERIGARAFDLLHVANAIELKAELFFTADGRQAKIAKAEGLDVFTAQ